MALLCMGCKKLPRRAGQGAQSKQRFPQSFRWLLTGLTLLPCAVAGAGTALPDLAIDRTAQAVGPAPEAWAPRQDYSRAVLLDIRAPALSAADRAAIGGRRRGPAQIGAGQPVPDAYRGDLAARLQWNDAPGGGVTAAFQVSAPGAKALRIALRASLPKGAAVRFFSPSDAEQRFEPYGPADFPSPQAQGGVGVKGTASSPPLDRTQRPKWSPIVAGSAVGVEIALPTAEARSELSFELVRISHLQSTGRQPMAPAATGSACRALDVSCATRPSCSRTATVRIAYTKPDGDSYNCTATTINDHRDTPARWAGTHLLTAHHCVSSQETAETLEAWWHAQTASCGSTEQSNRFAAYQGGADLVVSHAASDHSLLRLRKPVPNTAICWRSWSIDNENRAGETVESVHHPDGGLKEWAEGQVRRATQAVLTGESDQEVEVLEVEVWQGALVGGSSGAGLFANNSGDRLIGVLSGGPEDDCSVNHFGRFDRFFPYAKPHLQPDEATPSGDDHSGSISGATEVELGATTTGTLDAGDVDFFTFEVLEAGTVTVQTEGGTDTRGALLRADGSTAASDDDRGRNGNFRIVQQVTPGTYYVEVKGFNDRATGPYSLLVDFAPNTQIAYGVPLFPAAGDARREGFLRIVNSSPSSGIVRISAIDDAGRAYGPVRLFLDKRQTVHLNSSDLERGNDAKPISGGIGDGNGDWRLSLETSLDIRPQAYVRAADGFVTSLHDLVDTTGKAHHVIFFNPASNDRQRSLLRLINPHDHGVNVLIDGRDDQGEGSPKGLVRTRLPPWAAVTLTAEQLESGAPHPHPRPHPGLTGSLGDGTGKWQLFITSDAAIQVMSLMESPAGHLSNLSTVNDLTERN